MNRIGRRTAYAILVILVVAIVWQVLGCFSYRITAPGIQKGRIGATLGRSNLFGMKCSPGKSHPTVFHRLEYP